MESKAKICPACQLENPANALACSKCGSLFTVQIPIETATAALPDPAQDITPENNALFLFIMGEKKPTILKNIKEAVLGRTVPDVPPPTIDLTHYGNNQLGISRKHVAIEYVDGGYLLRDLGSSNGTWLNDTQLIPHRNYHLHSGDKIRLGLLMMTVFFKEKKNTEVTFSLHDPNLENFTLTYMCEHVIQVLQTINSIQKLMLSMLGRESQEMNVMSLQTDLMTKKVTVQLENVQETMLAIQQVMLPWQVVNKDLIKNDNGKIQVERLAQSVITHTKPDLPVEQALEFATKLTPFFRSLLACNLEIVF